MAFQNLTQLKKCKKKNSDISFYKKTLCVVLLYHGGTTVIHTYKNNLSLIKKNAYVGVSGGQRIGTCERLDNNDKSY